MLVRAGDGLGSTAEIIELSRDLGRPRYDLWEIAIWEESVNVVDNEVFYMQGVHQEADIILDNIDCIRAITGVEKDAKASIRKTDKAMGVMGSFRPLLCRRTILRSLAKFTVSCGDRITHKRATDRRKTHIDSETRA